MATGTLPQNVTDSTIVTVEPGIVDGDLVVPEEMVEPPDTTGATVVPGITDGDCVDTTVEGTTVISMPGGQNSLDGTPDDGPVTLPELF